jgi:hypothetical protein
VNKPTINKTMKISRGENNFKIGKTRGVNKLQGTYGSYMKNMWNQNNYNAYNMLD